MRNAVHFLLIVTSNYLIHQTIRTVTIHYLTLSTNYDIHNTICQLKKCLQIIVELDNIIIFIAKYLKKYKYKIFSFLKFIVN